VLRLIRGSAEWRPSPPCVAASSGENVLRGDRYGSDLIISLPGMPPFVLIIIRDPFLVVILRDGRQLSREGYLG
jgi:hypothetical protein